MDKSVKKKAGRPMGSRNKKGLLKAQNRIDTLSEKAVNTLEWIMDNNTGMLGLEEDEAVDIKERMTACKIIIDKAIANEKEKKAVEAKTRAKGQKEDNEEEDNNSFPLVSSEALD